MISPTNSQSFQPNSTSDKSHSQSTLSFATNNVVSFTDYTKRLQIVNESLSNSIDILDLSETNLTSKQSKFIQRAFTQLLFYFQLSF